MPFIRVTLNVVPDEAAATALTDGITRLMADILRKNPDLTSVLVESVPGQRWTIGGRPVPSTARVEAIVTEGTNSPQEKSAFIAAAMDLLRGVLPGVSEVSYITVTEIPAEDWGYGGKTQAARKIEAR